MVSRRHAILKLDGLTMQVAPTLPLNVGADYLAAAKARVARSKLAADVQLAARGRAQSACSHRPADALDTVLQVCYYNFVTLDVAVSKMGRRDI